MVPARILGLVPAHRSNHHIDDTMLALLPTPPPFPSFSSTMKQPLPVELVLHIIECIGAEDDYTTPHQHAHHLRALSNFALTCKGLLQHSQRYLFQTIRIRDAEDLESLVVSFRRNSALKNFVRAVHVQIVPPEDDEEPIYNLAITALVPQLPHLRAWHYEGSDRASASSKCSLSLSNAARKRLGRHRSIACLSLCNVSFRKPMDLLHLLLALPKLQGLKCTGHALSFGRPHAYVHPLAALSPKLETAIGHIRSNVRVTQLEVC